MKKFRIRQEVSVTEENGASVKEFSIDTWVSTEGISENSVKEMFKMLSNGFAGLVEEMNVTETKKQ